MSTAKPTKKRRRRRGSVYRHGSGLRLQVRYAGHTYRTPAFSTTVREAEAELDAYILDKTNLAAA